MQNGDEKFSEDDGSRLIKRIACWKAYGQNVKGTDACASKASPESTMCLCFLSTMPF